MSIRPSKRNLDEIRDISIKTNINNYAEGSCLISFGNTQIICTASVEEKVPHFLRNKSLNRFIIRNPFFDVIDSWGWILPRVESGFKGFLLML